MNIKRTALIICIAIPLIVGIIASLISGNSMSDFAMMEKPPLSPPGWLFPVVWTVLYLLMGIASYLVITSSAAPSEIGNALLFYGLQLLFNFFWTIWFFNFGFYYFAFLWLVILWILILITVIKFYHVNQTAALLMIPYLIWVSFAGYLNLGIAILN